MFRCVFTFEENEDIHFFDSIEKAIECAETQEEFPSAIISENDELIKIYINGEWTTFH